VVVVGRVKEFEADQPCDQNRDKKLPAIVSTMEMARQALDRAIMSLNWVVVKDIILYRNHEGAGG
jgi:hypothetical protein